MKYYHYPEDHVIWTILQHGMYLFFITLILTIILYFNADSFDLTEFRSILQFAAGLAGVEVFRGIKKRKEDD